MGGSEPLNLLPAARLLKRVDQIPEAHCIWLATPPSPNPIYGCLDTWWSCSAPFPSDALTGCIALGDQADTFDCAGIRVPKYILMLPYGSTLIVKDHFGYSVNPDRCLVQTR